MHNFNGTTCVDDGSMLITMGRRSLHNSKYRLLRGTDIAHNGALTEHFQKSEEAEQRRCT